MIASHDLDKVEVEDKGASALDRPYQVKIAFAYPESAALWMSWNRQSSPTMGHS